LACEAVGGSPETALPTAAAVEMIHTFTLIHDDVMDNDHLRRGQPTVSALWGDAIAITAGDGLFALAFDAIADNAHAEGVGAETALDLVRRAADTAFNLSRGQTMDLLLERDPEPTVERYMEMVRLKTGVLLEFALQAGAVLGGGTPAQVEAIGRFGAPLGMAFQIKDDILDLTGTKEMLGKPPLSDLRGGKRTLIVAHALENAAPREAAALRGFLDGHDEAGLGAEGALRILKDTGSLAFAEGMALDLVQQAKKALKDVPETEAGHALRALHTLADFVIHRER
jgi:geranylgeranyl diphosphate synthase type I